MTTYSAIADTEIDALSPVTDLLLTRFRDNPRAIAENDPSVPSDLRPILLLGTLATTSGSTVTLSSLVLTNYSRLMIEVDGVSMTATGQILRFGTGANAPISAANTSAAGGFYGLYLVSLSTGIMSGSCAEINIAAPASSAASAYSVRTGLSNASTSISFSTGGVFDAGNIRVYGIK